MKLLKEMKRVLALTCAVAMTVTSIQVTPIVSKAAVGDSVKFAVLSTTDVHGKCWGTNVLNDTSVKNSLLNVSTAVKGVRSQYGKENVVLIDNGDTFQGTPVSSYSITSANESFTGKTPMAMALKYLDYDAFVLGNHEFNYKWSTMQKVYSYLQDENIDVDGNGSKDAGVPVLAANLVYQESKDGNKANDNVFTPYTTKTIQVGGKEFKIGILGLENTDCTRWDVVDNYPNINFAHLENKSYDMAYEAQMYVNKMKDAGCDFIIASYHSGLGSYSESEPLQFAVNTENQGLRIVKKTTGIDMLITGHDHSNAYSNTSYTNKDGKDVLVVNAGGTDLTKTEVTATVAENGTFDVAVTANDKNIDVTTLEKDTTLEGLIKSFATDAETYVGRECGTMNDGWDTKTKFYLEQTDTMDLINRAQIAMGSKYLNEKYASGSAISVSGSAINMDALKASYGENYTLDVDLSSTSVVVNDNYTVRGGKLSVKDIYKFYKYDNSLYIVPMKGQEIKDALEFVAEKKLSATVKGGKMVYKGGDFTTPVFYGLDFTYDLSKEVGNRVEITSFKNGKAFNLDQYYNVAINNYHLSNAEGPFGNYKTTDAIWSQTNDMGGGVVQDLIAEYVKTTTNGVSPDKSNWKITWSGPIPEEVIIEKKPVEIYDPIADSVFTGTYASAVNVKDAAEKTSGTGVVIGQVVYTYSGVAIIEDVINGAVYGYMIYDGDHTYNIGDVVAATGTFYNYYGLPEIKSITNVTVIDPQGAQFAIAPIVMSPSEVTEADVNKYVTFKNVPASTTKLKDDTASISVLSVTGLPSGISEGAAIDATGVITYDWSEVKLRSAKEKFVAHVESYDPITETFDNGVLNINEALAAAAGTEITTMAQVAYIYGGCNNAAMESGGKYSVNAILEDVINGKVVAIQVYDTRDQSKLTEDQKLHVGDVVKVQGKRSKTGKTIDVPQISINATSGSVTRVKTEVAFQPETVTVSQLDKKVNHFVRINEVKFGTYAGDGNTDVTDATGKTVIYRGAEIPSKLVDELAKDATKSATVEGIASGYYSVQLRVGSKFDYSIYKAPVEVKIDKTAYRIPIVETTDVHGFLLDVSSGNPDTYQYRMARVADAVNDLRADDTKGDVLLLDAGDIYQGNPVSNLLLGKSMIAAYDHMKYDAVALGNHEFDWEVTELLDSDGTMGSYELNNSKGSVSGNSQIPVLCSNIYKTGTNEKVDFTKDYIIIEKEGQSLNGDKKTFKVAVFGYADDYSRDIMAAKIAPYEIKENELSKLEEQAKKLEASKEADVSVLLSHAGAAGLPAKLASDTAFDIILGGHTHVDAAKNSTDTKGVPYIQSKNQAYTYSYAELCVATGGAVTVENAENKVVYSSATKASLYNTKENATNLDSQLIKISDIAVEEVAPIMNVGLGKITEQVTKAKINKNDYSSTAGNFMTELMNAATGAKVSFTNNGGIRTEFAYEGESRMLAAGDIYTIAPFCNLLPTFNITYAELINLIEYAVGDGSGLGLRMGGATAYYQGGKVKTLFVGDKLIYNDGKYQKGYSETDNILVCTNEYIATSKGTPFKSKISIEASKGVTPLIDNEAFIATLKKEAAANNGNIYVNPNATMISGVWDGKTVPEDKSDRFKKENNSGNGGTVVVVDKPESKKDDAKTKDDTDSEKKELVTFNKVDKVKTDIKTEEVAVKAKDGDFYSKDGKKVTNAIVETEDGKCFIVNKEGKKYVSTMVETEKGKKYIAGTTGELLKGVIIEVNKERFYATKKTGKILTNKIFKLKGKKYIASKTGAFITGKIVSKSGKQYYVTKKTGKVIQDKIFKLKGKKYIASKSGSLITSKWVTIDGKKYYCNKNGVVVKTK